MAAPTKAIRELVYARDHYRCAACGRMRPLEFQHRQAVGMGGSKLRPEAWEGLVLCSPCNYRAEGDMQASALKHGWKVKRWIPHAGVVPVFYAWRGQWCVLDLGVALPITSEEAEALMVQAYGDEYEEWRAAA